MRPGLCAFNESLYVLGAGQLGFSGGTTAGVDTLPMPPGRPRCDGRSVLRELRPQGAGRRLSTGPS